MGRCCFYTVGTLSLLLLVTSIALLVARVFQKAVDQTIEKNIVLRNGSETFDSWKKPPLPVYAQFYFFNVTNPEEILRGEIPRLEEVGPYTYRELRDKADIQFGDNGTTISAVSNKAYVFERNQSVGDPKTDLIRTLNIPAVTAMEWAHLHFFRELIEALLKAYQQTLFVTHTVDELLWGYKDEILSLINVFKPEISPYFGLYYGKNGTNDGDYVFLTGEDNYLNFSKIVEWNGKTSLDWWTTDKCNMINGTDGDSFHPLIDKDEILYVFPSEFCRSVYITFSDFKSVQGLPAFRYKVPGEVLANTSDNAGFCVPKGNCLGSGVLNISICKNGAPIIISFPHFYEADKKFVSAIDGMRPNKDYHETFVDINPLTGIILRAAKRFQINVYVKKLDDFIETGNIRTMVFPVMYINESVLIDKDTASRLKSVINTTLIITNIPYIVMALGVFFGLIFTWLACRGQGSMDEGTPDERAPLIRT
ncbi:lysosome membrane protein 2 [Lycaon pictus]|uniref:Scavenger receptor class B member 2 n=3 Tax=Canis lupus TaxID=9612 RepID=A0A8C0TQJ6_CANLF|nr:lysosome membrane protein 2 isoform X2 [Canis lupus familiaris]XP_025283326.1 lysosome membrane protein 2 isoform X1 [Canis lupus dingo]XP_038299787.1 lysosome membrane protein 2 isoform X2 [Canis lupus familiaris]XP_038438331.1 lysosome membrane protein 2 isoform X2 [Canis lupus familiaris]|eukprot:XP_005639134.1 lysosome membrane protein 2 isoform X2 [Canis lupus familiaris]